MLRIRGARPAICCRLTRASTPYHMAPIAISSEESHLRNKRALHCPRGARRAIRQADGCVTRASALSQMAPNEWSNSDDEEPGLHSPERPGEESNEDAVKAAFGARIDPPGALLSAKRMRVHPLPDDSETWKWKPLVIMSDSATATDAAALKVFYYKAKLEGPGAAHIACSARRDGAHTTRL